MADKRKMHVISGGLSKKKDEPSLFDEDKEEGTAADAAEVLDLGDEFEGDEDAPLGLDDYDASDLRWSWVEIDTKAIEHNVREFKKRIGARVRMMAVVKADAYGHGAIEVARVALANGASWLGVATVREGVELRQAGIEEPILILSEPPIGSIGLIVENRLVPAVHSLEFALELGEAAAARGTVADYHLCVNTGMNRVGVWFADVAEFVNLINFHVGLNLSGTFTHFATSDEANDYTFRLQLRRFNEAVEKIRYTGVRPGLVHCANTAATIRYPESYFDMVRVGIGIYGLHPSPVTRRMIELWPAMSVHARLTAVKDVPVGEGVSYGLTYRSPGNVKICTVPIGYADGLSRTLSNNMQVIYKSKLYPQVGNICMDQFMFEVDRRSTLLNPAANPEVGDRIMIIGRSGDALLSLDEMADKLGTINYELACRFGLRMQRVYI